jgi:hypothetical protein
MRRFLISLVLDLIFVCLAGGQTIPNRGDSRVDDDLRGPVHRVRIETEKISKQGGSYIEGSPVLTHIVTFDEKRRKTEEIRLSPEGSLATKNVFTYNADGQLIEVKQYNNELFANITLYTSDTEGRLTKEVSQTVEGDPLRTIVYRYDAHGNNIEVSNYLADGLLSFKLVSTQDAKGRTIETAFCSGNQEGAMIVQRHDNEALGASINVAKMSKAVICGDGFLLGKFVVTYDDKGNETEVLSYTGGTLSNKRAFTGGANSKQFEIIEYNADGSLQSKEVHSREFDSHGNWVKDTKSLWDIKTGISEPIETTHRAIIYY